MKPIEQSSEDAALRGLSEAELVGAGVADELADEVTVGVIVVGTAALEEMEDVETVGGAVLILVEATSIVAGFSTAGSNTGSSAGASSIDISSASMSGSTTASASSTPSSSPSEAASIKTSPSCCRLTCRGVGVLAAALDGDVTTDPVDEVELPEAEVDDLADETASAPTVPDPDPWPSPQFWAFSR